jgi:precorrin-2/cobalt-factor-2 C20-methyltransferase
MNVNSPTVGRLYGVGLGPGDPELVTVKAMRILQQAATVAYFCKRTSRGHARTIAGPYLCGQCIEIPMTYPVTTEIPFHDPAYINQLRDFYALSAEAIAQKLNAGLDVAILCEGDPMFYGSFMHLYIRLKERFKITIVPGVTGMSGCWTSAGEPITWGDDIFTVLPGTLPADVLNRRLRDTDACVIMKLGKNFAKVRTAIAEAGLLDRAIYVERGTMTGERIVPLAAFNDENVPYFSVILIPGQGRRP